MKRICGSGAVLLAVLLTGCGTYQFQMVQPRAQVLTKAPVTVQMEPLSYELAKSGDQIEVRIQNPTPDRVRLAGEKSYVVGPKGDSHPLREAVIGPRSYTVLMLPPSPQIVPAGVGITPVMGFYPAGPAYPYGYGYYGGYTDIYYAPAVNYGRVVTPYDWDWKTGPARLRLAYERDGQFFDHDFEFVRERTP